MIGSYAELMALIDAEEPRRHDCEVRWVASFDTDSKRAVYLAGVWDKRGKEAATKLRADVWNYLNGADKQIAPLQEALFA